MRPNVLTHTRPQALRSTDARDNPLLAHASANVAAAPSFERMIRAEPLERIAMARAGLRADAVIQIAERMGVSREWMFANLAFAPATFGRKLRTGTALSAEEGARTLELAHLIGLAQTIVEESGEPAGFDASAWVAEWLEQPLPALGGVAPARFLDTGAGQAIVADMLERIRYGAYA